MGLHRTNKKYKKFRLNKRHFNGQLKTKSITRKLHLSKAWLSSIHLLRMSAWRVQPCFLTNTTKLLRRSSPNRNLGLANKRFETLPPAMNHPNPALPWDHKSDQYNQRSFRAKVRIRRSQLINNLLTSRLPGIPGSWQRLTNKVLLKEWASLHMNHSTINR